MMPFDDLFFLFGFPQSNTPQDEKLEQDIDAFKTTPHFKIGMFSKLIINGFNFKKQIVSFFTKSDPELDTVSMDEAGEFLMYNRAWYWISQCKIKSKVWRQALKDCTAPDLLHSVTMCIKYFESIEEYEKCAFLKTIQDFLEKNLDT
jgi:hypothetical protein